MINRLIVFGAMFILSLQSASTGQDADWTASDDGFTSTIAVSTGSTVKIHFVDFPERFQNKLQVSIADPDGKELSDKKGQPLHWFYKGKDQIEAFVLPASNRLTIRVGTDDVPNRFAKQALFSPWSPKQLVAASDYTRLSFLPPNTLSTMALANGRVYAPAPAQAESNTVSLDVKIIAPKF